MDIFSVKDFSAIFCVRILKFGTKLDSDELYCVTKEQPHIAYQFLLLFIFLSLQWQFLSQISQLLLEHGCILPGLGTYHFSPILLPTHKSGTIPHLENGGNQNFT